MTSTQQFSLNVERHGTPKSKCFWLIRSTSLVLRSGRNCQTRVLEVHVSVRFGGSSPLDRTTVARRHLLCSGQFAYADQVLMVNQGPDDFRGLFWCLCARRAREY